MDAQNVDFQTLFHEILAAKSTVDIPKFGRLFIKHYSYSEGGVFQAKYNEFFQLAKDNGIFTYNEREDFISREKLWTDNEEIQLFSNEKLLKELRDKISREYLYTRKQAMKQEMMEIEKNIEKYRIKKEFLIGQTAERYAIDKLNSFKVSTSIFKDEKLSSHFDLDELENEEYDRLVNIYYSSTNKFNIDNIKKLALNPFFTNIFTLCEDNAYYFYGKPIVDLTSYQTDLFLFGRYFKRILSERHDIPKDVMDKPDELLDLIELRQNAEKMGIINSNNEAPGGGSIMGATKADLDKLGLQTNQLFNLSDELKKKGGTLKAEDLYSLYDK